MRRLLYTLFIMLLLSRFSVMSSSPSIPVIGNDIVRLTPYMATYDEKVRLFYPDEPYKGFWLENLKEEDQFIEWKLNIKDKSEYRVEALICVEGLTDEAEAVLELSGNGNATECHVKSSGWQRVVFDKNILLDKGNSDVILKVKKKVNSPSFDVKLFSLEISTPKTYDLQLKKAKEMKADVNWMNEIPYGFFIHWNSKSMPEKGDQLKYADAVNQFDTDQFAKMVHDCGGKLVFFTTTWAEYYFPAPIHAIDSILPGRTTKRDLIADLSTSLSKYGIRLILYYHVGHGDKEWWKLQHFSRQDAQLLFQNVETIIRDISTRYKDKIAGLWLDDGIGYYPNGASFERINAAAKSGNKNMAVCFNPWILPRLTDFQDYYAGEIGLSVESAGLNNPFLPVGGNGYFVDGPQKGLKATYSGTFEPGDWTHIYKDSIIGDPMYSLEQLKDILDESQKRRNLLMINVRIYQDGRISPKTYNLLKQLKAYGIEKGYY